MKAYTLAPLPAKTWPHDPGTILLYFSSDSQWSATRDGIQPIEMIDSQELIEMFVTFRFGFKPVVTHELDPGFFEPFNEAINS